MDAPTSPTVEKVAPSRIAEVAAFMKAAADYDAWKAKYPDAATELLELADRYNPLLAAADKVVRAKLVSSGPFDLYQFARTDNGKALYDAVGRQKFTSLGGVLKKTELLSIDRERFDAQVVQDKIDPSVVAKVVSYGPRFHAPGKLELP